MTGDRTAAIDSEIPLIQPLDIISHLKLEPQHAEYHRRPRAFSTVSATSRFVPCGFN
jgi:hypothetical protein